MHLNESLPSESAFHEPNIETNQKLIATKLKNLHQKFASNKDSNRSDNIFDDNEASHDKKSPKPFLRRGSRREPSALNRPNSVQLNVPEFPKKKSPSTTVGDSNKHQHSSSNYSRSSTPMQRTPSSNITKVITPNTKSYFDGNSTVTSSVSLATGEWQSDLMASAQRELREFEVLERQLLEGNVGEQLEKRTDTGDAWASLHAFLDDDEGDTTAPPINSIAPLPYPPTHSTLTRPPALHTEHFQREDDVGVRTGFPITSTPSAPMKNSTSGLRVNGGSPSISASGSNSTWGAVTRPTSVYEATSDTRNPGTPTSASEVTNSAAVCAVRRPSPLPIHQHQDGLAERKSLSGVSLGTSSSVASRPRSSTPTSRRSLSNSGYGHSATSSNSAAKTLRPDSRNAMSGQRASDDSAQQTEVAEKMKELMTELETYRHENATLKKLRLQQESTVAETIRLKEEARLWLESEKQKVLQWCEEQRQAAVKERRAAAKQAKESRLALATAPTRKERAELEALQATIEKLKIDHETARKKWRVSERRLEDSLRDAQEEAVELRSQLRRAEEDKSELRHLVLAVGGGAADLPPERPKSAGGAGGKKNSRATGFASSNCFGSSSGTLAEEVEVEVEQVPHISSVTVHADDQVASGYWSEASAVDEGEERGQYDPTRYQDKDSDSPPQVGCGECETVNSLSWTQKGKWDDTGADHIEGMWTSSPRRPGTARVAGSTDYGSTSFASTADTEICFDSEADGRGTRWSLSKSQGSVHGSSSYESRQSNTRPQTETESVDGSQVVRYRNGTLKLIHPDGCLEVRFGNGDVKTTRSGRVDYYYAQADTTHTTMPDGLQIYYFPNKQVEKHFPDGRKEISFPDQTRKVMHPDGMHESFFPDGVVVREFPDGRREVSGPGRRDAR